MSKKDTIHFIMTGGTIDSYYEATKDTAVVNKESVIPNYIKSLKLYEKLEFTEVCLKDSRELRKRDLQMILNAVKNSKSKKIIITHGTYTMPDTARYLKANLRTHDQVIILTGSMIPLVGFAPSDAPFNLGYTIATIQHLAPGIFVAMNGRLFLPEEVLKVLYSGRFSSIFNKH
ncbi:MAG: Asparaginase [Parcubacteria group bacterium GW2011_GWA2_43_17]|nr:MAG: Asparaginase [Parcubacteria group bacterium GW2011_GWA2_43_17]KKT92481.1 MAG: Asparaginase [Parcubacteria group bacterium GW2011_GWF2_45_11]KKT97242.1 MAG: Asparaginase [Parcubacteria group bacterium GW2011_GWC2_45_15]OGY93892.1 MAG: hypothetical protein A2260_01275 [Candidatus Komeilibacteria bacterium RIFOXYA2_FULL_45_9]OGY95632.1 MAG: hypothetical protein A3J95_04395 [Candidatus Komeilibacteria bacterium RIFOXYC2_FULL_45_12]HAH04807.1 asparaginase [Candidatus Komeilibacteria bacteri